MPSVGAHKLAVQSKSSWEEEWGAWHLSTKHLGVLCSRTFRGPGAEALHLDMICSYLDAVQVLLHTSEDSETTAEGLARTCSKSAHKEEDVASKLSVHAQADCALVSC
jgi:hypothetical protein